MTQARPKDNPPPAATASGPAAAPAAGRPPGRPGLAVAAWSATAAAMLALTVGALLTIAHLRNRQADPLNSKQLVALKAHINANPRDREAVDKARQLDVQLRNEYFRYVTLARRGNWLLLACAAVFLLAARVAVSSARRLRMPRGKAGDVEQESRAVRRGLSAVLGLGALLAAGALTPASIDAYVRLTTIAPTPPHVADPAAVARNWPRFRGPGGQGVSAYTNVPDDWDGPSGRNILWKSPVPLAGKSSPVVWGDRVFLTGANRNKREVYCYDARTGRLMWTRAIENVPDSPIKPGKVFSDTGWAASTPAADDRHVLAIFANGDLACLDHDGKVAWAKGLGMPINQYSYGSSLVMYRNLALVLWDQGTVEDYMSRLLAFDVETGKLVWQKRRPVAASWATPMVTTVGGQDQLVTSANPWVISYEPATGRELWRAKVMEGGDVASSPTVAGGVVFAACAETKLYAIRANGAGDVTDDHVLWKGDEGLPDITSPLTDGKRVWLLPTGGELVCYDARTGKKLYAHGLERIHKASPSLVGDKVYVVSVKGVTAIVAAANVFKLLRTNNLGEAVYASPAFQDGRIYMRGHKDLFCIADTKGARPTAAATTATTPAGTQPTTGEAEEEEKEE
jgi:outer membrane protein assembly factor BamB